MHSSEIEVDLKEGGRSKDVDRRRSARAPCRAAGLAQRRPAHLAPARSHALGRAGADRHQVLRRGSRYAARARRGLPRRVWRRSKASPTCRSKSRCASRSSRSWSTTRGPPSTACSRRRSPSSWSGSPTAASSRKLVDGTRRFDVVLRLNDSQRTTQGLGDLLLETPYGWVPVRHIAEVREGDGPNQILRENGKRRVVVLANADGSANMTRLIADIRRELAAMQLPQGFFTSLEGTFQAQEEASRTIASALAALAGDDLCHSLQPLPLGGAGPHHHGQRAARADRQRRRAVDRRTAALGRLHDRLHHADRHRLAQRHPQDQPLHQSGAAREHALRPRARRARQPGAHDAGADDGARGRASRCCR